MESRPLNVRQLGLPLQEQRPKWRNEEFTKAKELGTSEEFINILAVDRRRIVFTFWIWKPANLDFAERQAFAIILKHLAGLHNSAAQGAPINFDGNEAFQSVLKEVGQGPIAHTGIQDLQPSRDYVPATSIPTEADSPEGDGVKEGLECERNMRLAGKKARQFDCTYYDCEGARGVCSISEGRWAVVVLKSCHECSTPALGRTGSDRQGLSRFSTVVG